MKKKFGSTQAIADEFVARAPEEAVRGAIAQQAGRLMEMAVLDGIDISQPLFLNANHEYDMRMSAHVSRVSLVVESLPVKRTALERRAAYELMRQADAALTALGGGE